MFDPSEETEPDWDKELSEDVKSECAKYGNVLHCSVDPDSKGHVYVKFETVGMAHVALTSLQGRYFAGKQVLSINVD